MNRKFFICSVGEPGKGYDDENYRRCKEMQAHVMHQDTKQKGVFEKIKEGDIAFLKYKNKIVAFGMVDSREVSDDESLDGWTYLVKVKKWFYCSETNSEYGVDGVGTYGVSNHIIDGSQMATIKEIESSWGLEKMKQISLMSGNFSQLYNQLITERDMEQHLSILVSNHNLILTGAPGTGKTYLAKQIAKQMIFGEVKDKLTEEEKNQFNEQCGFVQFHPSYDYTDFVEGLRPTSSQNGNEQGGNESVGFERVDGVFKEFCKQALKCLREERKLTNFEDIYKGFIDEIMENGSFELETQTHHKKFNVSVNSKKNLNVIPQTEKATICPIKKGIIRNYLETGEISDWKPYLEPIGKYVNTKYEKDFKWEETNKDAKFVFIIDEINRGEISKIFGELFFSIDPGYRGKDGKVRTQYANMQTTPNEFDKSLHIIESGNYGHFFVPENVYIIGTMNDIDRSVESMDFAFRRRFAFKEIAAEESKQMLYSDSAWGKDETGKSRKPQDDVIKDVIQRMDNVNNIIWHNAKDGESEEKKCIDGLSSAYHIGASYFLKLVNYKKEDGSFDYDKLWDNHLEGLLFEYMRGMPSARENIKRLAKEFGYTNMSKYE